jgi:hypothetical protein
MEKPIVNKSKGENENKFWIGVEAQKMPPKRYSIKSLEHVIDNILFGKK